MIITRNPLSRHTLPGVTLYPVAGELKRGFAQQVLVLIEPNGTIPLHVHDVDAAMDIVSGAGIVLSDDPQDNGVNVKAGDCVFFEKLRAHGFKASAEGLTFLSTNGGIVDEGGDWDYQPV